MSDKNKKINKILEELYDLDPELKKREKELKKAVATLIKLKPEAELDQEFSRELKGELLSRFSQQKKKFYFSFPSWAWMPVGAMAGIAVIVVSVLLAGVLPSERVAHKGEGEVGSDFDLQQLEDRAFGDISIQRQEPREFGVDGGGQLNKEEVDGRGSGDSDDEKALAGPDVDIFPQVVPNLINYNFVYTGEELNPDRESLNVFKRVRDDSLSRELADQFGDLDLGLMDWEKLQDTKIKSFSFVEDREFGYSISFDPDRNYMSLSKNWSRWPDSFFECQGDSECLEEKQLNLEDIPPEEELVAIADDFLQDFGVDVSSYGDGRTQEYWQKTLELTRDKDNFRVPDSISVVYPLRIDSKTVYGRGGDSIGLRVNVDIRHQRVSGLRDFYLPRFRSSSYPAIREKETILSRAQEGGLDRPYSHSEPTKTVEVELGTPELELVRIYNRKEDSREAEELYVPAYVFPVTQVSEKTHFFKERVVVPIIEGVWEEPPRPDIGIPERQ